MLRRFKSTIIGALLISSAHAQQSYQAELMRSDGHHIFFNLLEVKGSNGLRWTIKNADERIQVNSCW